MFGTGKKKNSYASDEKLKMTSQHISGRLIDEAKARFVTLKENRKFNLNFVTHTQSIYNIDFSRFFSLQLQH